MPRQASLAAGVLQTAMRLSISIGLAITAAVYGSEYNSPQGSRDLNLPYFRAYLCSILFSVLGLFFIPFMKIETQGRKRPPSSPQIVHSFEEDRPRTGGEYSDDHSNRKEIRESGGQRSLGRKVSNSSKWSVATVGTEESYFPRWSWEDERWIGSRGERYRGAEVVYEVCVKCLEERKVILGDTREILVAHGQANDGIHGVWNSPRGQGNLAVHQNKHLDTNQYREWNGGEWNNDLNHHWYAQRGVREGGDGWL
jgi:hypothetical protein